MLVAMRIFRTKIYDMRSVGITLYLNGVTSEKLDLCISKIIEVTIFSFNQYGF